MWRHLYSQPDTASGGWPTPSLNTVGWRLIDTMVKVPLFAAAALLLAVSLPAPAPVHADPPLYPPRYGSNGIFGVGPQSRDQVTAFIPPGRYRADVAPGWFNGPGFWMRCSGIPCGPNYPDHVIATGDTTPDGAPVDLLPTDTAVFLFMATLTFVG
ncbi:MAG: hypothetical protein QOH60_2675 [Mycobacterium sp.]|nr:hypothetical protein [Mycobacterium sp.]